MRIKEWIKYKNVQPLLKKQFSQLRAALLLWVALAERPNTKAAGSVDRFLSIENHSIGEWFSAYNKKCVSPKTSHVALPACTTRNENDVKHGIIPLTFCRHKTPSTVRTVG